MCGCVFKDLRVCVGACSVGKDFRVCVGACVFVLVVGKDLALGRLDVQDPGRGELVQTNDEAEGDLAHVDDGQLLLLALRVEDLPEVCGYVCGWRVSGWVPITYVHTRARQKRLRTYTHTHLPTCPPIRTHIHHTLPT